MAGVGMDGMGIWLDDTPTKCPGTGSAEGTGAFGAATDAGMTAGMWCGTRTSTDTGAD